MTQGVFVNDSRPRTKKVIKEAIANGDEVYLEATSAFGNEYDGPVNSAPNGTYTFVGPDPYKARNFYGNFIVRDGKVTVK